MTLKTLKIAGLKGESGAKRLFSLRIAKSVIEVPIFPGAVLCVADVTGRDFVMPPQATGSTGIEAPPTSNLTSP